MSLRVLIAGATGALGSHVVREALARGHQVRALVRHRALPDDIVERVEAHRGDALSAAGLGRACASIDVVFSCAGASVLPDLRRGRRSFHRVDLPANRNLIGAATGEGVRRFVYVGVAGHEALGHLRYVAAHEAVVDVLRASKLSHAVIRPVGFFSAFATLLDFARKGSVPLIGDGSARTNPIHEADLARVCVDAVEEAGVGEAAVGGPEVLSRRQIAEFALAALGAPQKIRVVPSLAAKLVGAVIRPINPRVADLTAFYARVSNEDLIAPRYGTRRIAEYFEQLVAA
ncbi:MAG: NAD(P)H-binding protein [Gemmatimonadota bacterium]